MRNSVLEELRVRRLADSASNFIRYNASRINEKNKTNRNCNHRLSCEALASRVHVAKVARIPTVIL